jgi:hypothetical protein
MSAKFSADLVMRFWEAVSSCPHVIDADEVRLKFDPAQDGHNAANQLYRRMERALTTLFDEMQQSAAPSSSAGSDLLRRIDDLLSYGASPAGRVRDVATREPQFDVCAPGQEDLVVAFVNEISQTARERGATPDPVRLLEMAEALYRAEADEWKYEPSPDVEYAASGRSALRRMVVGLEGAPEGEWLYRPFDTDDWGWVRLSTEDGGPGPLVATARSGEYDPKTSLDEHRRAGTDPFGPVATHVVATQPRAVRQVARLVEVLDHEIERLTALDREHARLESWIVLNTDYQPTDPALDPTDRLERALDRLLCRTQATP